VSHHSVRFPLEETDLERAAFAASSSRRIQFPATNGRRQTVWFVPLITWKGAIGTIAFIVEMEPDQLGHDKWLLLDSVANLTGLAILRANLEHEVRAADVLSDADKFQKALLHSISHNVRTPLASIIGVLSTLQESRHSLGEALNRELVDTARQEAERLNRLLGNLLDLSRLEAGALRVRADPCDIQDLVGAALEQLGPSAQARPIDLQVAQQLPFVPMDFVLIAQVLVNLLDNAIKYSPPGTPITLEARLRGVNVEFCVADHGHGIAEEDLGRIFEKFNRAHLNGETGGVGLGLSICKGLVEAHHGKIWAERLESAGTAFRFTLPLAQGQ
jgi:two-component system sensor histidine kinase KdpD